jgi:serine/threonine protein kinase
LKYKRNIYLSHRLLVIGDLSHSKSSISSQTFGTNNYLAPEAHDLRRSNKIDIWSFGCIVYELFILEKLFNLRNPDKLRSSILNFQAETDSKIDKIKKPLYAKCVKRYLFTNLKILIRSANLSNFLAHSEH